MAKNSFFIDKLTALLLREQVGEYTKGVTPEMYVQAWEKALHKWWKDNSLPEAPPEEIVEVVKTDVAEGDIKEILAKLNTPDFAQIPKGGAIRWLLQCILKMPTAESHLFFEDLPMTLECLKIFVRMKDKKFPSGEPIFKENEKNLFSYTHKTLEAILARKKLMQGVGSVSQEEEEGYKKTGEIVPVKIDDLTVIVIRSFKACERLGLGSKWCTRQDYKGGAQAQNYMRQESDDPRNWIFQIKSDDGKNWVQAFSDGQMKSTFGAEYEVGTDADVNAYNGANPDDPPVTREERIKFRRKCALAIKKAVATIKKRLAKEDAAADAPYADRWAGEKEEFQAPPEPTIWGGSRGDYEDPLQERFNRHLRKVPLYD